MLELRRKKGQDIFILVPGRANPIKLTVNRFIKHPRYAEEVEIVFDCDTDIQVLRHELYKGDEDDDNRGNK